MSEFESGDEFKFDDMPPDCPVCGSAFNGTSCRNCGHVIDEDGKIRDTFKPASAQSEPNFDLSDAIDDLTVDERAAYDDMNDEEKTEYEELLRGSKDFTPNEGQQVALREIAEWIDSGTRAKRNRKASLCGAAGTGKTSILKQASKIFDHNHLAVMWTAMTGKAATRMREAAGVHATTLHSKLYEPPEQKGKHLKFNELREPDGNILVIDEASMVTPQINEDLDSWVKDFGVKVIFVGDGFQLPPVLSKEEEKKFGKGDYSIFSTVPGPILTQVMRNGDSILDAATELRTKGTLPMKATDSYELLRVGDPTEQAIAEYLNDPDDHGLITWVNKTRMGANLEIRRRLGITALVPQPGEPILVCKNGIGGMVLNGEVYRIKEIDRARDLGPVPTYVIRTEDGKFIYALGHAWDGSTPYFPDVEDFKKYKRAIQEARTSEPIPITYGHVLTAHKAQGSEYRRVTVFLPKRDHVLPFFKNPTTLPDGKQVSFGTRWLYTAMTRSRKRLSLVYEK